MLFLRAKWIEFENKERLIFIVFSRSLYYVQTDVLYNHQRIQKGIQNKWKVFNLK